MMHRKDSRSGGFLGLVVEDKGKISYAHSTMNGRINFIFYFCRCAAVLFFYFFTNGS